MKNKTRIDRTLRIIFGILVASLVIFGVAYKKNYDYQLQRSKTIVMECSVIDKTYSSLRYGTNFYILFYCDVDGVAKKEQNVKVSSETWGSLRIGDNVSCSVTYTEDDILYIESQEYGIEEKNVMHEEGDLWW